MKKAIVGKSQAITGRCSYYNSNELEQKSFPINNKYRIEIVKI
jgi:hypothetical protein